MAFRFPGDLHDEASLWEALSTGRDLVDRVGEDRWAVDQLQHPKRAEPGRSITFSAGVLSDIDAFDAQFFGISPREAALLDPQQRILLELAWEAMENGGQIPAHLAGSDCAVYIGISGLDYGMRMLDDMASMTAHSMTGNTLSIAANRLSYFFDLRGPSMAVDTACSSSLAALHQACSSLQSGESSLALAGGVNLLLHPYPFIGFTKASMLSANGRCRVFDAAGDGYVRAEGGAVFLLKPLAKAETDGDSIRAVILASGMNADGGRKTSITIPSPEGQVELMRGVLQRAGLPADRVAYVEAHGTGTTVGDPIEARAIAEVYARRRQAPLLVGSVKSNLGHLEPASGMAGLVKTILALEHEALPPSLHCSVLNPAIDFVGLNLEVVTGYLPLRRDRRQPLVMGVNSFGFGGANAHVLLQAYRRGQDVRLWLGQPMPPLFLSARTPDALRALAGRYAGLLRSQDRAAYYDVAYCAAFCRQHLDKRLALKVSDPGAAVDLLDRFAKGEQPPEVVLEDAPPGPGAVAFVYSGNGSQWVGMGQRLLAESSRFSALIAELDAAIAPVAGFSILDALRADAASARLDDTAVAQPLLFAIQVAITRILREQGIAPAAVAGHSVGEVAAAWAAGALALDQAIDLICARSAAQALTRGDGRMAAVGLSAPDISEILRGYPTLELAGINGPSAVTIAGSLAELEALQARLAAKGTFFHLLDLDYAFHSRSMDEIRGHLLERLAELEPTSGTLAFVSTVAGDLLDGRSLTAGYWWDNVRRPVRFAQAMKTLIERGCRTFVEIGPHTILRRYMTDCLAAAEAMGHVIPSLRRNDDGAARLDEVALRVKLSETEPDLRPYFPSAGRFVRLPNYPWQRERHWHPQSSEAYSLLTRHRVHPLLGWRLREAEAAWENTLDPIVLPYLADHRVAGAVVLPAAAYVEMALAAARERFGGKRFELEGLDILTPVVFDDKHTRTLRFELSLRDGGFRILSRQRLSDDPWTLNAVGRLLGAPARPTPEAPVPLPEGDGEALDAAAHYRLTLALALEYGPAFQGFAGGSALREAIRGQIALPEALGLDVEGYLLHPAALDVCFQSLVHAFRAEIDAWQGLPLLPVRVGRLCYYGGGPAATFQCRVKRRSARSVAADFAVLDGESRVLAALEGCRFRAATLQRKAVAEPAEWGVAARLVPHRLDLSEPSLGPNRIWVDQARAWLVDAEPVLRRHDYLHAGLPLLDALVVAFAYGAFEELSETHAVWLQQALDQPETVPAERRTFFLWLVRCLREASLLREKAGIWHLDAANAPPPADDIWRALLADFPDALPELVFVGRVGRRLAGLIRADEPAQDLADAIQRSHLLETLFDGAPAYRAMNLALREILRAIGAAWPANRRLRILEISGGSSELPHQTQLPTDRLDYVIAHAEGQRLARLEAEHEPHPFVTVATLNEADLTLSAGPRLPDEFDLILVHHWLHRAPDLAAALGGVQRRLAPGGLLILAERYPDLSADCIFGVAPAWWQETAAGHASSLLRPSDWAGLLREAGLEDVETLVEPEAEGLAGGAYLLLARSPARSAAPVEAEPQSWLLLCGTAEASASLGTRLARALESQGQHVMLTREGGADSGFMTEDAESLRGLLATAASELGGIHHLVNLTAVSDEGEVPPIAQNGATDAHCLLTLHLAQAIATETWGQPRLWLVTSGGALVSEPAGNWRIDPLQAPLWGLGRVIMNELPALACTLIDLALDPASGEAAERLQNELLAPDGECEIVLAPQARFALRVRREQREPPDDAEETPPFRLDFQAPGQLRNLAWVPQGRPPLGPAEIEVRPAAVGLNFRDVMYAMGLLPDEAVENGFAGASLGLEFAGAVSRVFRQPPGDHGERRCPEAGGMDLRTGGHGANRLLHCLLRPQAPRPAAAGRAGAHPWRRRRRRDRCRSARPPFRGRGLRDRG
jgi:phthiocerol/phenolphthiocerol synthesis type-I polyketide synthase C